MAILAAMSPSPPERPGVPIARATGVRPRHRGRRRRRVRGRVARARPRPPRDRHDRSAPALAALAGTAPAVSGRRKPQSARPREEPVPPPARVQPGRLVRVGRGGVRQGAAREQADLPLDRLLDVPLVPRHGARVVRGRRGRRAAQRSTSWPSRSIARSGPTSIALYMTAMQAMGMGGGWPLNVFLTPELEPFYGGTYFPPRTRQGRPGLIDVLPRVHEAWRERPRAIVATRRGRVFGALDALRRAPTAGRRCRAAARSRTARDARDASRRPRARRLRRRAQVPAGREPRRSCIAPARARSRAPRRGARRWRSRQLDAMRAGGIHDHLGGGFHRYSTDREWLVPHFEKMLYDQAAARVGLPRRATRSRARASTPTTARDVFDYVARDLTAPEGAFLLGRGRRQRGRGGQVLRVDARRARPSPRAPTTARSSRARYGVTPTRQLRARHQHPAARRTRSTDGASPSGISRRRPRSGSIARARTPARGARATRMRAAPRRQGARGVERAHDLGVRARRARARRRRRCARARARGRVRVGRRCAIRAPASCSPPLARGRGRQPRASSTTTPISRSASSTSTARRLDPVWLERAATVTEAQIARFWDERGGGFFDSPAGDPHLPLRMKDDFDGAEMSGNSIAAPNLLMLGRAARPADVARARRRTLRLLRAAGSSDRPGRDAADAGRRWSSRSATPRHIVIAGRRERGRHAR